MELIQQKNNISCGPTSAAMILGEELETVEYFDKILFPNDQGGISPKNLCELLSFISQKKWKETRQGYGKKIIDFDKIPFGKSIILIRKDRKSYGHYIAIEKNETSTMIFDPELIKEIPIEEYHRKDWELVRVIISG